LEIEPGCQVRWRPQHEVAQHIGGGIDLAVEGAPSLGIGAAEFRELMFGLALRNQQITAVGSREKILRTPLDYAKPVIVELQIPDALRVKQAHRVGGDRVAEAGINLLRYRRAAYDASPLKNLDLQPRQAEIGGAGEAVVSR